VFVLAAQIAGCVPQQQQPQQQLQQPTQPQPFAGNVDDLTFGPGSSSSTPWDQFSANERMFGVVTSFNEEAYTTAIDRNAPDFKEKERKAEILAKEIMGVRACLYTCACTHSLARRRAATPM
jgi:PAB1-binding protein PBP1